MFTSHHSTKSFMSARCHRFLDITSTFRGVNASLLTDTTRRGLVSDPDLSFWSQRFYQATAPLEYMLTCGTKGHYILPLSDLSKTVIVMTRIPRMIHGIVQVLVSLWFYYLTRPSRKRIRVTKTPITPHLYIVKLGFTEGIHNFLIFAQNIDCGYALEPPQCIHNLCFEQK